MAIHKNFTPEQLQRMVERLARTTGQNQQWGGASGRKRRNLLDVGNLDVRDLSPGLGLKRPEAPEEIAPMEEIEAPTVIREEDAYGDTGDQDANPNPGGLSVSPLGKALGHDQFSPDVKGVLGRAGAKTALQTALMGTSTNPFGLGSVVGLAKGAWNAIKGMSEESDVSKALSELGLDPFSDESKEMTDIARNMTALEQETLEDPDKLTNMNIDMMSRTPEEVSELQDVMAKNTTKSPLQHLRSWLSYDPEVYAPEDPNSRESVRDAERALANAPWNDHISPMSFSETMNDMSMEEMEGRLGHLGLDPGPKGSLMGYSDEGSITGPSPDDGFADTTAESDDMGDAAGGSGDDGK